MVVHIPVVSEYGHTLSHPPDLRDIGWFGAVAVPTTVNGIMDGHGWSVIEGGLGPLTTVRLIACSSGRVNLDTASSPSVVDHFERNGAVDPLHSYKDRSSKPSRIRYLVSVGLLYFLLTIETHRAVGSFEAVSVTAECIRCSGCCQRSRDEQRCDCETRNLAFDLCVLAL